MSGVINGLIVLEVHFLCAVVYACVSDLLAFQYFRCGLMQLFYELYISIIIAPEVPLTGIRNGELLTVDMKMFSIFK